MLGAPSPSRQPQRPAAPAPACGDVRFIGDGGDNQEGLYWRYEMHLRRLESALRSITAGNGAIYATRAESYLIVRPMMGHDISFPFKMVKRGWRAVYAVDAHASEKMAPSIEGEYARKRRMASRTWPTVILGGMLSPRGYDPIYALMIFSHRVLRYLSPFLHVIALGSAIALIGHGWVYLAAAVLQVLVLLAAALAPLVPLRPLLVARYYVVTTVSLATGLWDWLTGVPTAVWEAGRGDPMISGRRALDLTIAVPTAILTAPVVAALALAIKLDSRGPVLYRQVRVGLDGRHFRICKLRTMIVGAEFIGAGLAVDENDDRITRVGRVLRRYSLDELTNLWNVLSGDMAIVGPRPTVPVQVDQYTERQRGRLAVRPGLTGWAQVNGRASLPWSERIELDLWYVQHRSLWLDLRILAATLRMVLSGHGLYHRGEGGGWIPPAAEPDERLSHAETSGPREP